MTHHPQVGWNIPLVVSRQQNRSRALRQHWGQKVLKRKHIFAYTISVRNGIDSVVL